MQAGCSCGTQLGVNLRGLAAGRLGLVWGGDVGFKGVWAQDATRVPPEGRFF
jgi:hypothetical protein